MPVIRSVCFFLLPPPPASFFFLILSLLLLHLTPLLLLPLLLLPILLVDSDYREYFTMIKKKVKQCPECYLCKHFEGNDCRNLEFQRA